MQFLCPSSGILHCKHSKPVWHIPLLCVQWKTSDDGQRNCPKHVEFYSKNKFEKLVHLVGFIIRIYHAAWPPECEQWKPPDDGQKNCPKHVEFYSKNTFEKLVRLVGFIIRIHTRCLRLNLKAPKNKLKNDQVGVH